ncbi:MAG: nicotinate-nucleotide--dimethylbenzimidazole phosphoribosyltransferase [Clostridiales bacterium GWB2_37_7]|nr:MAG: nicotinate-nucleotide--dimethylbenzimidazole phosphoribosyltransferase [Clostridiales bacterium GWB2_37_7]
MELLNKTLKGIKPIDELAKSEAIRYNDSLIKPIGSLGTLEHIAAQLAGITGKNNNSFDKKCTIVMAADNGIHEEGVSACPQEITAVQTVNMIKGITGICVLSKHAGAEVVVVDIGVKGDLHTEGIINKKISHGTKNIAKGPAMTREQAILAVETGIELVGDLVGKGYSLFGTGEMGICNTSTSSAILMALSGISAEQVVGKGAGLTDADYENKKRVIERALETNKPDRNDVLDVLAKVGGYDIAGMAGCFLGAAYHRVPIVVDGFISIVAALVAYNLNPKVRDFMIASHHSEEPGYKYAMNILKLEPMLTLHMRLGEGTGCPIAFNIIEASQAVMKNMATFEQAAINDDFLVDIR